jgi:glutamate N-acetyltransferase/amino-acid N-acetyltransferase
VAVGLSSPDNLWPVNGVTLAAGACGLKASGADDILLISLTEHSAVAGVFTQNAYCAAPVTISRECLAQGSVRALLINSGNANAGTGKKGHADALELCAASADALDVSAAQVMPFSTGVIGSLLPVASMKEGIGTLAGQLKADNWLAAASAIMTTDTLAKGASRRIEIDGQQITLTGISKGSGMIHPNMATMLSFIATDAAVENNALQKAVSEIADASFNCITVDGDTSTNDSFVTIATGAQDNDVLNEKHPQWSVFYDALLELSQYLAHAIVRDGEGATRFISIAVSGGLNHAECREVGLTVAHSPLVKTAFFAGDPNLGRILAAIGRSRIDGLDMNGVSVSLADLPVVERGEPAETYNEDTACKIMAEEDILVSIDLGRGDSTATVWTTDLSYEYVKINAEYRS